MKRATEDNLIYKIRATALQCTAAMGCGSQGRTVFVSNNVDHDDWLAGLYCGDDDDPHVAMLGPNVRFIELGRVPVAGAEHISVRVRWYWTPAAPRRL